MPGPIIAKPPLPGWIDPAQRSVFDVPGQSLLRSVVKFLGLDDPNQIMAVGVPLETGAATGGALDALAQKFPRLAKAIKAYHGSPHDFEQFSTEKIGTGEGAQAYGHGLYFAENPAVAEEYKRQLQEFRLPSLTNDENNALDPLIRRSISGSKEEAQKALSAMEGNAYYDRARAAIQKHLAAGAPSGAIQGKTYEVAIHADPESFLDWDKPLSQQSEQVQRALETAGVKPSPIAWDWKPYQVTADDVAHNRVGPSMKAGDWTAVQKDATGKIQYHVGVTFPTWRLAEETASRRNLAITVSQRDKGEALYRDLQSALGQKVGASETLKQAGIPGIKYLDQGSRAAGEGSRNYVVFDDRLVEILKKYGIAAPAIELMRREYHAPEAQQ